MISIEDIKNELKALRLEGFFNEQTLRELQERLANTPRLHGLARMFHLRAMSYKELREGGPTRLSEEATHTALYLAQVYYMLFVCFLQGEYVSYPLQFMRRLRRTEELDSNFILNFIQPRSIAS